VLVRPRSAGGLSFFVLLLHHSFCSTLIGNGVKTIRLSNAKPFQRDSVAIVRNGAFRRVFHHFHGQIPCLNFLHPTCALFTGLLTGTHYVVRVGIFLFLIPDTGLEEDFLFLRELF